MSEPWAVLNPNDNQGFALSIRPPTANAPVSSIAYPLTVKSNNPKKVGKFYVEFLIADIGTGTGATAGIGIVMLGASFVNLGSVNKTGGMVLYANGTTNLNGTTSSNTIGTFTSGDRVCFVADIDNLQIYARKNNGLWNGSMSADPSTLSGGFGISPLYGNFVLAVLSSPSNPNFSVSMITDPKLFIFTTPAGGITLGWPDNEFPDELTGPRHDLGASKITAGMLVGAPALAARKFTAGMLVGPPGQAIRKATASMLIGPPGQSVRKLSAYVFVRQLFPRPIIVRPLRN